MPPIMPPIMLRAAMPVPKPRRVRNHSRPPGGSVAHGRPFASPHRAENAPLLTNAQPQLLQPITIPASSAHPGTSVSFQSMVTDGNPANPRGLALGNAVQVRVGAL